jgi:hypothetical protein
MYSCSSLLVQVAAQLDFQLTCTASFKAWILRVRLSRLYGSEWVGTFLIFSDSVVFVGFELRSFSLFFVALS